jgi:acyl carrier protein
MTREEMLQTLAIWIGEITERLPPALTFDTDLVRDLRLDSLALAELGSRVRVRYRVRILPSELTDALRVGAMIDLVRARLDRPRD